MKYDDVIVGEKYVAHSKNVGCSFESHIRATNPNKEPLYCTNKDWNDLHNKYIIWLSKDKGDVMGSDFFLACDIEPCIENQNQNKMKKFRDPGFFEFTLNTSNPATVNMVLNFLREKGVPIYEKTKEFDPEYPYLYWTGSKICQRTSGSINVLPVDEFINKFDVPESVSISLNSDYKAEIYPDKVVVGCQTIPIDKVKEVIKIWKENFGSE